MAKKMILALSIACLLIVCGNIFEVQAKTSDMASNEEEFIAWLETNKTIGGTLTLTQDITISSFYDYVGKAWIQNLKEVTINTNGYHINIQGTALFTYLNYKLVVQGEGGETGLFHVLPGGHLELSMMTVSATDGKYTVVQEEDSVLLIGEQEYQIIENGGSIKYAKTPKLELSSMYAKSDLSLKQGEKVDENTFNNWVIADIYYLGKVYYYNKIDVEWDISVLKEIELNAIYPVSGKYVGDLARIDPIFTGITFEDIYANATPVTNVIWTTSGCAITNMKILSNQTDFDEYEVIITYRQIPDYVNIMFRDEKEAWVEQPILSNTYDMTGFTVECKDEDTWICAEVGYGDDVYYSNVVSFKDQVFLTNPKIDGGRGGGISILPDDEDKQEPVQPDDDKKEPINPDGDKQEPVQPDDDKNGSIEPDGDKQEPVQPDDDKNGSIEPDGDKQKPIQPDDSNINTKEETGVVEKPVTIPAKEEQIEISTGKQQAKEKQKKTPKIQISLPTNRVIASTIIEPLLEANMQGNDLQIVTKKDIDFAKDSQSLNFDSIKEKTSIFVREKDASFQTEKKNTSSFIQNLGGISIVIFIISVVILGFYIYQGLAVKK